MVYRYLGSISMLTPFWSAFEYLSGVVVGVVGVVVVGVHIFSDTGGQGI